MWLWQSFKASVYDPAFYRSMKERKSSLALGYFALVVFVASLAVSFPAISGIYSFVFHSSEEVNSIRQQVLDLYPDWLELKVEGGKLSMNAESPFAIPMPRGAAEDEGDEPLPANLIVINTEKPIEVSDFDEYDTLIILGEDTIGAIEEEKGKVQIQEIGQFLEDGQFTLVKDEYAKFVAKVEKLIKGFSVALLFLVPIIVFGGLLVSYLVYLLLGALVIWAVSRLCKTNWSYGTAYKAGLYLITVPVVYDALPICLGIPFVSTAILFCLALINIRQTDETVSVAADSVPEVPVGQAKD